MRSADLPRGSCAWPAWPLTARQDPPPHFRSGVNLVHLEERLDALHAQFHLQRQTAITTELLDIVSGYEALTGRS